VDDFIDACLFLIENYSSYDAINVGTGNDISIKNLANLIKEIIGYTGSLTFDTSKPDGMFKRQLDISKISSYGWKPTVDLCEGIKRTYSYFLEVIK
jgi:GDP-L-fucose synthase